MLHCRLKRFVLSLATTLLFTHAMAGFAQEVSLENIRAYGGGDGSRCTLDPSTGQGNVLYVANGMQLSLIFDTFGINLPKSRNPFSGPLAWSASCNIEADFVIPQGYAVKTLSQSVVGGVFKDVGPAGGISTNAFLFQDKIPLNQINWAFGPGEKLFNVLVNKENTQVFTQQQVALMCAATAPGTLRTKLKFQMLAAGARPVPFMNFQANIDAGDLVYGLVPSLVACR
jgi:hypothetical protein